MVVGVSASHVYDFSEELSPPVKTAVPKMIEIVVEISGAKDHNSLKKKVIRLGDFLHLGRNLIFKRINLNYRCQS